jgi:LacI family transcriptional regulator
LSEPVRLESDLPFRSRGVGGISDRRPHVGCYEALRELGLNIPADVAVMGYDDREIAQHLHPPLSSVLLPHFEMDSIAAEILIAAAGSAKPPRQIKVECPIVRRKSV